MRIAVLGGTRFLGMAIVEELLGAGHDVRVVHRGRLEPEGLPTVPHVHVDRHDAPALRAALAGAEAVVDTNAYSGTDAREALTAIGGRPAVALSSQDIYRAFATVLAGAPATDRMPVDEDAPLAPSQSGKHEVEPAYLAAGATVLRLPMVYGERDYVGREEFVLRRVRAGRRRIPFGAGTWLWSRAYVRDAASAVRLAVEGEPGGVFNVAERTTPSFEHWARDILAAAGSDAELVRVPDTALPTDLELTASFAQHLLVDAGRFRARFGWRERDPDQALRTSVAWHLAHPPADDGDFSADDAALR